MSWSFLLICHWWGQYFYAMSMLSVSNNKWCFGGFGLTTICFSYRIWTYSKRFITIPIFDDRCYVAASNFIHNFRQRYQKDGCKNTEASDIVSKRVYDCICIHIYIFICIMYIYILYKYCFHLDSSLICRMRRRPPKWAIRSNNHHLTGGKLII